MTLNVTIVLLYAANLGARLQGGAVSGLPLILSIAGICLLVISGWLGGQMVFVHRVGVRD